jgi:hypothetical protein
VSQTHNIEAKLKAREAHPDASLEERAKQREVSEGEQFSAAAAWMCRRFVICGNPT